MRSSSPVSTDPHEPDNEHDNDQAQDVFPDPKDGLVSLPQSPLAQAALFVLDRTLRDTGFDISCLDALDEQLLRSPTDSFLDICWTAAVQEERVQRKQDVFQELNVDVVDMGVDVDAVHGDQMHTVEKYPKIEPRGISVPSTPQQSFAVRRKPPPTLSPLSSSLSSAESEILVDQSLDPRRKLVEDAAPSPQYHEKKVLTLPITPSTYEAHHINLPLTSDALSPKPTILTTNNKTKDCPDVLAASGVRMLYSNPNDSVHYFPVPRGREKKERRDRTSSSSRESNRKKSQPQSRTQAQTQSQSSASTLHSSPSSSQLRSQQQAQGYAQKQAGTKPKKSNGVKKQKQRLQISSPTPIPSPFPNIVVDANANTNAAHAHAIPIAIPTFPASGYNAYLSATSSPPCPPLPAGYSPSPPSTPKSANGKLRVISNAYSTLTGRRRVKSTV